ncbi:S-layer homology domain-containing protein [Paenibacillus thailandensis]|uniref:S-layer homology domain-containing protein n=1 Tax=Paenibacillus thailandensis TaxID=393250 RepID=A0ABW5QTA6_9BACL
MLNNKMLKKTALSSMALLVLAGGGTAAFAQGGQGGHDDKDRGNESRNSEKEKNNGNKATWKFEDEAELKWATESIMRLASKGVFTGYEDGTFKPNQKISRIEAIVAAVRVMELEDEAQDAMDTELNFKDADLIEKKYPWAVGYVAVALENDLFAETETKIDPAVNATRLWSTTLLVKALGLEEEAKEKSNTKLDFKDADKIPAGSVGYVAVALEKGIITGYNDNTFRPNQPVTRAELAALLDRTDEELPDHDAAAIEGELKSEPKNGKMTIVKDDDTELTLELASDAFIFREGKKVKASALEEGDELFIRTYENKAVFIEVTEAADEEDEDQNEEEDESFEETGVISSITLNASGKLAAISIVQEDDDDDSETVLIFNVSSDVKIKGDASDLAKGTEVELEGENSTVTKITIK